MFASINYTKLAEVMTALFQVAGILFLSLVSALWYQQDGISGPWSVFALISLIIGHAIDRTTTTAIVVSGGILAASTLFVQSSLASQSAFSIAVNGLLLFVIFAAYGVERRLAATE